MELFRGDSFIKKITSNYQFRNGDKLHIAVLKNAYSREYLYEQTITMQNDTNEINFEILPSETDKFPIEKLLLEIELTTIDGIVKTNQYELTVKADGIYERN
jgi:hypothetical protein